MTRNIAPLCNKSINTMGQTELLKDLCGMAGLDGDESEVIIRDDIESSAESYRIDDLIQEIT